MNDPPQMVYHSKKLEILTGVPGMTVVIACPLCGKTSFELRKENDMSPKKKVITVIIGAAAVMAGTAIGFGFYNKSDTAENRQQSEALQAEEQISVLEQQVQAVPSTAEETPDLDQREKEVYYCNAAGATVTDSWKQAYIDLVNQYEAGQYDSDDEWDDEYKECLSGCVYSLVNFHNWDVPELVIEVWGSEWAHIMIYTYDGGTLCKMGELFENKFDHCYYISGAGIVIVHGVDGAGTVNYYHYLKTGSDNRLVPMYEESLIAQIGDDNVRFYFGDMEITEEEYDIYYEQRSFQHSFTGFAGIESLHASEIIEEINSQ